MRHTHAPVVLVVAWYSKLQIFAVPLVTKTSMTGRWWDSEGPLRRRLKLVPAFARPNSRQSTGHPIPRNKYCHDGCLALLCRFLIPLDFLVMLVLDSP